MKKELKRLSELIDALGHFRVEEDLKRYFEQLDSMLQDSYKTNPLIIFSYSNSFEEEEVRTSMSRMVWNKKLIGSKYTKHMVQKLVEKVSQNETGKGSYNEYKDEVKDFFTFYLGDFEGQSYFGLFSTNEKFELELLRPLTSFSRNALRLIQKWAELDRLESLVFIDDVTGLYNQRKLLKDLDASIQRYKDLKEPFSVLFLDIDHFKNVNDGHGHIIGTKLLSEVAMILKDTLRDTDWCYRYGGDEFVAILTSATSDNAIEIGNRILKKIKSKKFNIELEDLKDKGHEFNLSVSIGVAGFPSDASSREEILSYADKMMYEAKKSGRGQVCYAGEIFYRDE